MVETSANSASKEGAASEFHVLQMNLCNSGLAACYSNGHSLSSATYLIATERPNAVFVSEICEPDLYTLAYGGVGDIYPDYPATYFVPIRNSSGNIIQCTGGRGSYGSGIFVDNNYAYTWQGGNYSAQFGSGEARSYGCARFSSFIGCVTHLESRSKSVAMAQCNELMNTRIPQFKSTYNQPASVPVIASGDLNLEYNTSDPYNVQNCVPSSYWRKGNGGGNWIGVVDLSEVFGRGGSLTVRARRSFAAVV
ncbi:hypothetical protein [Micromonospora craniellae]|uniref:hypothetical protein n=1 Tax=Micromonospora craniellae TaxID=2294034 RepID=UPI0011C1CD5E|nr:hypothetical protein [Micromonospora craniellae]QOC94337.1 hypothetical protein ID554_12505 [Micromonospora craniellae]